MKFFITALIFASMIFSAQMQPANAAQDSSYNYLSEITALEFYPSGAKFTFNVESSKDENFEVILPGAFIQETVRVVDPRDVDGGVQVVRQQRTRWTPDYLKELKSEADSQAKKVEELSARKSSLEQTLEILKTSRPKDSASNELLNYIKEAQDLRLKTESELSELRTTFAQEQEKLSALTSELARRRPSDSTSILVITGKASGTFQLEAFTRAASWRPHYLLDLDTNDGEIVAYMYAKLSQKTGLNYTGEMKLHTRTPDGHITEPVLNPLRVAIKHKEESVVVPQAAFSRKMMSSANDAAAQFEVSEIPEEDSGALGSGVFSEGLADRVSEIEGTVTGDGKISDIELDTSDLELESKPIITLIPEQHSSAWILAEMKEGSSRLIPGEADMLVDGFPSGRVFIPEYGIGQKIIPFGYAEQITAKKEALIETTGVSWFNGVSTSGYKLEITNGSDEDRTVTVRDRLPIPTDDKIKLNVRRIEPREKERDQENRLTWEIELKEGETKTIIVDYTLSYPSGEELQYK